jgi:hypothetical protein
MATLEQMSTDKIDKKTKKRKPKENLMATISSVKKPSSKIDGYLRLEIVKLEADTKEPKMISIPYDQVVLLQSHFIACRYKESKQEWKKGMLCVYFNDKLQISIGFKSILDSLFQLANPKCEQVEWLTKLPNEAERKETTFYHILFQVECFETPPDWSNQKKQSDYMSIPMTLMPEDVSIEMWFPNVLAKRITTKTMDALTSILVEQLGISQ